VRVCGEWKFRMLFDDPRCINLFRKAGELGCPVVLHLDVPFLPDEHGQINYVPAWYGGTVANLERALQACPRTNFIGHAPGFWREISGDADHLASAYPAVPSAVTPGGRLYHLFDSYPNLFADISAGSGLRALRRDPAHAECFIERYADRLLFGRDYYGSDWMDFLQTLTLSQAVRHRIFSENAQRLTG
jgi:predicted TIM-barrel fold metal-dependent hydrolase